MAYTNLYKFGKTFSPQISLKKNSCDVYLGVSVSIFTIFLFPDSGRYDLLDSFDFYFDMA